MFFVEPTEAVQGERETIKASGQEAIEITQIKPNTNREAVH